MAVLLSDLATEIVILVCAVVAIVFSLVRWYLVSRVKVSTERSCSSPRNNKNGYNDSLIEEEEGINDHNVVAKCAEIQNAISEGISRSYRDILPAHIIFKIESFSNLLKSNSEKYHSDVFEAMGYNWRVTLYPRGRTKGDKDHLSVYLEIVDTDKFIHNWEVYVNYKLFVYNYLMDSYYTIQDVDGKVRRFHSMMTKWGFDKFLSLETLTNDSNGYIKGDSCVFGAEVFIIKHSATKSPSIRDETNTDLFTWKIEKFSSLKDQKYRSNIFVIGGYTWKLLMHPKGNGKAGYLSLYLVADWVVQNPKQRLYAEFKLRVKSQLNSTVEENTYTNWFCSSKEDWGFAQFISLENLNDASKGFLVNDSIILEGEITSSSLVKE